MNSSDRIAATRYAQAYSVLGSSEEEERQLVQDLHAAAQALAQVKNYMTSPRVMLAAKKALIAHSLKQAPKTAAFITLLLTAKRYYLLDEIAAQVQLLLDKRTHIVRAEIVSASELTDMQKKDTLSALSARYGGQAEGTFRVDPSVLGGLKITCNGDLIDGTFKARLQKLQEELTK